MKLDWRINPQERSLEPPEDDEQDAESIDAEERAMMRQEDKEVESFMEGR